jgi:allophanate hydrolase subunit 1
MTDKNIIKLFEYFCETIRNNVNGICEQTIAVANNDVHVVEYTNKVTEATETYISNLMKAVIENDNIVDTIDCIKNITIKYTNDVIDALYQMPAVYQTDQFKTIAELTKINTERVLVKLDNLKEVCA